MQRTFTACVAAREQFRSQSSFRTYLFAIARNQLYTFLRQLSRTEQVDFEVESERVTGETWLALGLPPRASFVLRLPLRKERPEAPVKLVRRPVTLNAVGTSTLYGVVVSPEDTPIVEALIEIPAFQLLATTDRNGRFHFPTVPSEPRKKVLRIRARGRQFNVTTEQPTSVTDPLVIRFNPMEV